MKTKWILTSLLVLAGFAAFWLWQGKTAESALGQDAYSLTKEILAFGPRPPPSEALSRVKNRLAEELKNAGWLVRFQEFERQTPNGLVKFSNLRARYSPTAVDPWEKNITGLLCAHIDSKYFKDKEFLGADDAASACAAVVEIGKHLAQKKPLQAQQIEIVLFDGEEAFAENMTIMDGLYGSRYYANSWRSAKSLPAFGILLDMVGHENLSIRIPSDSPPDLAKLMFETAKKQKVGRYFGNAPGPIMDDHLPLNLIGIPTIDLIGDFTNASWWHTLGDDITIISPASLSISIGVTLGMLDSLLEHGSSTEF